MGKSVKGYDWVFREYDKDKAYELHSKFEISEPVSKLLAIKGIDVDEVESYLNPKIKNLLHNPFHLIDMELAVSRLISAIDKKEKITIFGDYDVDGATSSALLKMFLAKIGIDANVYIPDRIKDGYGPSNESFRRIIDDGTQLIICVDCGTVAHQPICFAKQSGVETVVIDHHLGAEEQPCAVAVVNPNRLDEKTEYKNLAAVGVVFLLCVALNKRLRDNGFYIKTGISEPNLMNFLDLVALGTICDVMALTGLNRAFVLQGLKVMRENKNIGLKCMFEAIGIEDIVNAYHLGFLVGPRINAGGRVGNSSLGSKLLSTNIEEVAREISHKLDLYNKERQTLERLVLEEVIERIEKEKLYNDAVICVYGDKWHDGVIGIVASRVKERYNKPSVIITLEGELAKASCRSINNVDIGSVISKAKNSGLLVEGGGHIMAGGFSILPERVGEVREFFNKELSEIVEKELEKKELYIDLSINPSGVNLSLLKEFEKLGPYGAGNHKPLVLLKNALVLKAEVMGKDSSHIRCIIASDNLASLSSGVMSVAFNTVNSPIHEFLLSSVGKKIDLVGNLNINRWGDKETAQFIIEDARNS